MIADYYVYRKRQLDLTDLYRAHGRYSYHGGFSGVAIIAAALAILPNIPGFLVTIKLLPATAVAPFFVSLYHYAWFVDSFSLLSLPWLTRLFSPFFTCSPRGDA